MALNADALFEDCARSLKSTGVSRLDKLRGSTLLIAGGSGFVGLWLSTMAAYLNDAHGFRINIVGTARRRSRVAEQAAFLLARKDYEFRQADVRQLAELPYDVQWIVNAAGSPDSRQHATDPISTMSVFADGTDHILRLAEQAADLKAILHFSSSAVYGEEGDRSTSLSENAISLDATSAYAEAKRFGEVLCAAFRTQARLPIIITRPFTFVGPFQPLDAPWAINHFLHAALEGQPLKVQGAGDSVRALLYGSDMAALVLHQLVGGKSGTVFNLGGTSAHSLREIAELVVARSGRQLEIRYNTAGRPLPFSRLVPDMSASESEFSFKPAFSTIDAVSRTLQWYSGKRGRPEGGYLNAAH
ncbi:MAG: NAD(P)-dependent oxidoreductase [Alphaproteobacteria bacterium]|nr:MAG: NAD(P)-dependent oxidoreductase [Alphaproteobacteria bacterium]